MREKKSDNQYYTSDISLPPNSIVRIMLTNEDSADPFIKEFQGVEKVALFVPKEGD